MQQRALSDLHHSFSKLGAKQHRQCVHTNCPVSRHNAFNGHDEIVDYKVSFF